MTGQSADLRLIAEKLLDKDQTVRTEALDTILAAGKLADDCADELDAYFKDIDQNHNIQHRISELHQFGPKLADSSITLGDPSALISLRNKVLATERQILAESVVQYLSELIGHCGARAISSFPMLKERAMKTFEFRDVRACIWMAIRCPELIPQTLELIDYVAQHEDENTASQAIMDASFLGIGARPYVPRLIEIMNDVSKGGVRSAAANTLGNIIDKSLNKDVIQLLINYLQDENNHLVYGCCKALGTIFANDHNADRKMLEAIAKVAQGKTYDLQDVGRKAYTNITGQEAPSEDLPIYDPIAATKKAFEGLENEDPFVVMESLNTIRYSQEMHKSSILAEYTKFIPLIWDFAFNTPDRFEPLTKHWAGIDGFKKVSMSILANFGNLAQSYIPQLMEMVQNQISKGEPDEWGWETIDILAAVGKDNQEVLALFEEQLNKDNGSNWASPLSKMGDDGIWSLINSLHSKTARLQEISETDNAFKLLTGTQEHICILLMNAGEKALPAIPTLIFIALDKKHQNETAHFCGGSNRNNRIYAAHALCKLAPRDARVLEAFEQLRKDPTEAYLYREIESELTEMDKLEAEKKKPATLKAKISEFFQAIQLDDRLKVERMLAEGIDANSRNVREGTVADQNDPALVYAARVSHNQIIKMLIEAGADLDATGHNFDTPIRAACERGNVEGIFYLLKAGAVPRYSPLEFAAVRGDLHLTIGLLLSGVAPGKALTIAAQHGFNRVVEELLAVGKTANTVEASAMNAAVANGNMVIAKALKEASDDNGNDAELLQQAISNSKFDIAKLFIDAGAAKNLRNDFASLCMHKLI
ncbi:MAG: ankyrin repeat domain-containing protein, partial [Candidatus Obscuribacterales bacterium]|nr:ankyrin repeat domain-containing protein [Candidatus Obscuribacterales bacterium]